MKNPHIGTLAVILSAVFMFTAGCGGAPEPEVTNVVSTPERHIVLDGQPNFRDLGGYETTDGRTVKWGQVFRSGELPRLSDDDMATLEELEISTVVQDGGKMYYQFDTVFFEPLTSGSNTTYKVVPPPGVSEGAA
ncbi:MAG: tyrosine-protein phosphatase [Thermoanaerobaculales bacterium]|nr:tyrosine-protein phosphatase [Thermoanaerobaculales bacterium]